MFLFISTFFLALSDSEWMNLYERMGDYVAMVNEVIGMVGSQQLDDERANGLMHKQYVNLVHILIINFNTYEVPTLYCKCVFSFFLFEQVFLSYNFAFLKKLQPCPLD